MIIKFGGRDHTPFWSCRKWDGPHPRACEGRRSFSLHPDDLAEYEAYTPLYHPDWSEAANKVARQAALNRKWRELQFKSLARVNGGGTIERDRTPVLESAA
jgi:hypothetical protein